MPSNYPHLFHRSENRDCMVVDGFPVAFAGICDRADDIDISFLPAVQLKIAGVFAENCGQVRGTGAGHYEIHRADVTGTLLYDIHAAPDGFEHVIFVESLNVVDSRRPTNVAGIGEKIRCMR